jgi:hypothetical protein
MQVVRILTNTIDCGGALVKHGCDFVSSGWQGK